LFIGIHCAIFLCFKIGIEYQVKGYVHTGSVNQELQARIAKGVKGREVEKRVTKRRLSGNAFEVSRSGDITNGVRLRELVSVNRIGVMYGSCVSLAGDRDVGLEFLAILGELVLDLVLVFSELDVLGALLAELEGPAEFVGMAGEGDGGGVLIVSLGDGQIGVGVTGELRLERLGNVQVGHKFVPFQGRLGRIGLPVA